MKKKSLCVADNLEMPLDLVTRTTAIVGQRGTGKTSTAVVMAEEAVACGAQVAWIDPTGAAYGLRSSADGEKAGLEVVVFGGHHGDVPLEHEAGAFLARLVIDQGLSVVLDLELMTKAKQVQFVAEFAEDVYHHNRTALTVVIDEAHRFAPQQLRDPGGYGARCLGAVTDVVTLGRRKGLGAVLISQRPAKINKDVLEQAEVMIAHRLMGPNDRKAIAGWLDDACAATERPSGTQPDAVRYLERGEAILYAPTYGVYGKYTIRPKRTFDSSATPEVGATVTEPRGRADVDLAAIEEAMSATIERAKADDPKALRARIVELEDKVAGLDGADLDAAEARQDAEAAQADRNMSRSELDDIAELLGFRRDTLSDDHGAVLAEVHRLLARPVLGDGLRAELRIRYHNADERVAEVQRSLQQLRDETNRLGATLFDAGVDLAGDFTSDDGAARSAPTGEEGVHSVAAPTRPAQGGRARGSGSNGDGRAPSSPPAGGGNAGDPGSARAQPGSSTLLRRCHRATACNSSLVPAESSRRSRATAR